LTPSLPLGRPLGPPICLARFPAARLWLKDESLEDNALKSEISDQMSGVSHDVQAGLAQFGEIAADLKYKKARGGAGFM
jgi:hypothetical protein